MTLEEVQFSRLIKGCIVKVKYPVDVQAQLDIRRYSAVCEDAKKGDAVNFSLSPEEYYKVFEIGVVDGKPVIWLDLVQDIGYIQPWIYTKFLTLDDECNKYNEEIFSTRKNVNLTVLKAFLELGGMTVNDK